MGTTVGINADLSDGIGINEGEAVTAIVVEKASEVFRDLIVDGEIFLRKEGRKRHGVLAE